MKPIYMQKKKRKEVQWQAFDDDADGAMEGVEAATTGALINALFHIYRTWKTCEWLGQAATT